MQVPTSANFAQNRFFFQINSNFLSKNSITKIDALKQGFNPVYHEALLQQESTAEEGKVIEEYEKGYLYHDKIIRHSKVVVSKGKNK